METKTELMTSNFLNSTWGTQDYDTTGTATTAVNWYDPNTYVPFYTYWTNESKIEKSFKLVQKLIENKVIKEPATVKQFIELINTISEVI